ncbi:hypothetical protein [Rhodopirellula baltica]|uniref:Uncharacterized protein n=1 Tax=Rhodopirellula baltica SWK14 TaxID=993516 RepID=L7CNW2_RHOBT|nr:hypothetical protein [Rhodopirellula baltica]ELP35332.1 hypothetical protein RBSWK_00732 [Rhodopirellula baltica SWK14]
MTQSANVPVQRGRANDSPLHKCQLAASVATDGYHSFASRWGLTAEAIIPAIAVAIKAQAAASPAIQLMTGATFGKEASGKTIANVPIAVGMAQSGARPWI